LRIFILSTDYGAFLSDLYGRMPRLAAASFGEQEAARRSSFFADAYAWRDALAALGHEVLVVTANNEAMQNAWLRARGERLPDRQTKSLRGLARIAAARRRGTPAELLPGLVEPSRLLPIVVAQAASFEADVVLIHDLHLLDRETLQQLRRHARVVVGQHAATSLGPSVPLELYDAIFSSFPPTIAHLQNVNVRAVPLRLAFDRGVLAALAAPAPDFEWEVTFVGSLQSVHSSRARFLEGLAERVPELRIWTPRAERPPRGSVLRDRWQGTAFGLAMYEILRASQATVNHHGDVGSYANNLRLYEATGVGTLLLTDRKQNLGELFVAGDELIAYDDVDDCAAQLAALDRPARERIAAAGQARTLGSHTFDDRAVELVAALDDLL
jgi:hypothetical protein